MGPVFIGLIHDRENVMVERFHAMLIEGCPRLLWILLVTWICAGCTAVQLASGDKGSDVTKIQPGLTRTEAEAVLGSSVREWKSPTGVNYRTYQYDGGRPTNVSDAIAVGLLDVMTLGIMEAVIATGPDTMEEKRTTSRVVISYDEQDVILGVFDEFDELPPDGRSSPRQWRR